MLKCARKSSEDRINTFPQFVTDIEGMTIHFVGLFSEKKDAVPLLLLHGWPGMSHLRFDFTATDMRETHIPDYRKLPGIPAYIAKVPRGV
jgi:microsomal epoxide hydrolase